MQKKAVQAINPDDFSEAGTAPILQIIAEGDPWNPCSSWREFREECGDRVTTRIVADASRALFPEQTPMVAEIVISSAAFALALKAAGQWARERELRIGPKRFHLQKRGLQITENSDFGSFGRYEETPVSEMSPAMKDAYDSTKQLRGLVPGPHKIWLANPALRYRPSRFSIYCPYSAQSI